ncbi:Tic20 family protein [Salix suchowensis]|nr:Tic20 family protein [Salix suchowensis]
MILNGCAMSSGSAFSNTRTCKTMPRVMVSAHVPCTAARAALLSSRASLERHLESKSWSSRGLPSLHLSAASTPLLSGDYCGFSHAIPTFPRQRGLCHVLEHQKMSHTPGWWWRTLACLPYLMPLHETWMYAETAYHLHPFLEDFEFLTYPFLVPLGGYQAVVRRKEWPHFFRFHVVMGMLLEIALQVIGTVSRWMPLAVYWGKLGMHFWTAVAFAYLFTVLECIRCALAGMYADVPFACDAAYIQIPYD